MSSTIFYRFLHQKEQSTIKFDGTGINVFDLKHDIISQNQLGQGTDFMLRLYHLEQPDLEYENDQDVIPRSTFVLAKRSPSYQKNGKYNNASRYVSGKPRINRKVINNQAIASAPQVELKSGDENMTEEDRIKLMFENQSNVWAQTQDELSQHKLVYNKPTATSTNPDDIPPPGYICYRCGGKDHWIKNCPTLADPNFEGKRIKRTTGIPKSYLKTISKETVANSAASGLTLNDNGELVDQQGNTYMITDTGEYVMAMADSATWNAYQEKQQSAARKAQQEYEEKITTLIEKDGKPEFLDPLSETKKVLVPPIAMTPCCQSKESLVKLKNFNYNKGNLEDILIDNDFHCPNCGKEDTFIDSVIANEQLQEELEKYVNQKSEEVGLDKPTENNKRSAELMQEDTKRPKFDMPMNPMLFPPFGMPMGVPPMFMPPPPPNQMEKK